MAPGDSLAPIGFDALAVRDDAGARAQRFVPGVNAKLRLGALEYEGRLVWRPRQPSLLLEIRSVTRSATS